MFRKRNTTYAYDEDANLNAIIIKPEHGEPLVIRRHVVVKTLKSEGFKGSIIKTRSAAQKQLSHIITTKGIIT